MKSNQFWAAVSKALAAATVMLIVSLLLAPGASAADKYKILHRFTGRTDGGNPQESVILDTAGNLYGTTTQGGASGNGTVFKLTTTPTEPGRKACSIASPAAAMAPVRLVG